MAPPADARPVKHAIKRLPRSFYLRPALRVAPELLGKYIVRCIGRTVLAGIIVETEAYRWDDPASHSYRGETPRNKVMFGPGGFLYVYFTYGMHFCSNVVTGVDGVGEAVLIRAVEPVIGIETMMQNRFASRDSKPIGPGQLKNLTNGPAKFCQAFAIARDENGTDLRGEKIYIGELSPPLHRSSTRRNPPFRIGKSGRIGIAVAKEKLWRFFMKGNPWVSR